MKKIKFVLLLILCFIVLVNLTSCDEDNGSQKDTKNQLDVAESMAEKQPTPTDIDYSLERYNLIRRAYWVNGQREKAINLPCEVDKPLGYIYLFSATGQCLGQFTVDGKVSSLGTYLTPDYYSEHCNGDHYQVEMPDVDGCYGTKDSFAIFFFTTDGKYIEWTADYLYTDIPFNIKDTVLQGTTVEVGE